MRLLAGIRDLQSTGLRVRPPRGAPRGWRARQFAAKLARVGEWAAPEQFTHAFARADADALGRPSAPTAGIACSWFCTVSSGLSAAQKSAWICDTGANSDIVDEDDDDVIGVAMGKDGGDMILIVHFQSSCVLIYFCR